MNVLDPNKAIQNNGLGLNFARRAIEKMGGTIRVENIMQEGVNKVKFTIGLPKADPAMSAPRSNQPSSQVPTATYTYYPDKEIKQLDVILHFQVPALRRRAATRFNKSG